FVLNGERAGISFDIDATLQRGLGSSRWDPTHMLDVIMGGQEIDPVVDIDETRLNRVLARVATAVEVAPINARVTFPGGQPTVTDGHDGVQLDMAAASDAFSEAVLAGDKEVALPVASVPADVGTDEARQFADGAAARAVSGPVRVKIADVTRTLGVGVFAPALRAESDAGRLALTVNQSMLAHRSRAIFASLPHHPVNAKITFRNGRPSVVPSTSGVSVARVDWANAVLIAVQRPGDTRFARAKVTPDTPRFTTSDARRLKIDQRLASATLPVTAGTDLAAVRSAAARLDGSILRPRDDFSFLARVGAQDEAAATLVASVTYDAAFRAGMQNIFRSQPHASVIGSEPGLDAAAGPGIELAWVNQTPYGVYVRATVSSGSRPELTVALWSHPYWQVSVDSSGRYNVIQPQTQRLSGTGCQSRRGIAGFDVDVNRTLTRAGENAQTDRTHSHYAPVDAIVCAGRRHR
ncbi:MAG TPA: peptidoglycan binding domain-containing protein, partial [Nocardioidaceae bacterium]|nr:peptidoglycan binding domain-containing protein [Nocardioidaceae bacterium]